MNLGGSVPETSGPQIVDGSGRTDCPECGREAATARARDREPDQALPDRDRARRVAEQDRRDDAVRRRIDATDRPLQAVRDPDRSRAEGHAVGATPTSIVRCTARAPGSIRQSVPWYGSIAHAEPAPTARSLNSVAGTWTRALTRLLVP
jgi:hypothetical protein